MKKAKTFILYTHAPCSCTAMPLFENFKKRAARCGYIFPTKN